VAIEPAPNIRKLYRSYPMRKVDYPSPQFLRQCFLYNDGKLFWKERPQEHFKNELTWKAWNGRWAGKEAGYANEALHFGTRWMIGMTPPNSKWMLTYRSVIVWYLFNDDVIPDDLEIDHEDRDKLNDRIENLRLGTRKENGRNISVQKNKKSGLPKGLSRCNKTGRVYAQIKADGSQRRLGTYDTIEEAQKAYLDAAEKGFGEFATDGVTLEKIETLRQLYDNFEDVPLPIKDGVEFRRCLDHEGWCVGDNGTAFSCIRSTGSQKGLPKFSSEWRKLKLKPHNQNKYCFLSFVNKETGKKSSIAIHKLVFEAFNGPVPDGMLIRHKNDTKTDARLENLCLGTKQDNADDSMRNGKTGIGETHSRAILTEEQVIEARRLRRLGMKISKIYKLFRENYDIHVDYGSFAQAIRGITWKHISVT
jgi:HNH endonuclease